MFSRSKAWAIGLLVTTFTAGLLVGGGAERLLSAGERGASRTAETSRHVGYLERLTVDLELSDAQQQSIRAILEASRPTFHAIWQSVKPAYDSTRTAIRAAINQELNQQQQQQYQELIREIDERRARKHAHD